MLPFIFDIPDDPRGWDSFAFQHANDHLEIVNAVKSKKGISLPLRQLYPVNLSSQETLDQWLEMHQQAHNEFTSACNISGVDLTGFDLKDREKMRAWAWSNFQDHQSARQVLGI